MTDSRKPTQNEFNDVFGFNFVYLILFCQSISLTDLLLVFCFFQPFEFLSVSCAHVCVHVWFLWVLFYSFSLREDLGGFGGVKTMHTRTLLFNEKSLVSTMFSFQDYMKESCLVPLLLKMVCLSITFSNITCPLQLLFDNHGICFSILSLFNHSYFFISACFIYTIHTWALFLTAFSH